MPIADNAAIGPQYEGNITAQGSVDTAPVSTSTPSYVAGQNANDGASEYQRYLDLYTKADPILSPETYDTSDMPATKAANAEAAARRQLEATNLPQR